MANTDPVVTAYNIVKSLFTPHYPVPEGMQTPSFPALNDKTFNAITSGINYGDEYTALQQYILSALEQGFKLQDRTKSEIFAPRLSPYDGYGTYDKDVVHEMVGKEYRIARFQNPITQLSFEIIIDPTNPNSQYSFGLHASNFPRIPHSKTGQDQFQETAPTTEKLQQASYNNTMHANMLNDFLFAAQSTIEQHTGLHLTLSEIYAITEDGFEQLYNNIHEKMPSNYRINVATQTGAHIGAEIVKNLKNWTHDDEPSSIIQKVANTLRTVFQVATYQELQGKPAQIQEIQSSLQQGIQDEQDKQNLEYLCEALSDAYVRVHANPNTLAHTQQEYKELVTARLQTGYTDAAKNILNGETSATELQAYIQDSEQIKIDFANGILMFPDMSLVHNIHINDCLIQPTQEQITIFEKFMSNDDNNGTHEAHEINNIDEIDDSDF